MQRALSTHLFANHRLTTALLDRIRGAGIPLVEIYCGRQHLDYHDRGQIAELGHWFRDADLKLHSLHAPIHSDDVGGRSGPQSIIDITGITKARRIQAVDEIKRCLEIAETVPYAFLVQHIGIAGQEYDPYKIDSAFSSLEEITVFARHRGVEILIENIPNELSHAQQLLRFFDLTHMDLDICFDTGHAHLRGNLENEYVLLKPRIRSTHVHDNNGEEDQHLFPMLSHSSGTIDWRAAMTLLDSAPNQYPLLLELKEVPDLARPLDMVSRTFDQLEEL